MLHSCCAPCSSAILEWLREKKVPTTVFFYNPNIFPDEEYLKRKDELVRFCQQENIPYIEGDYDHLRWREAVKGLEDEPERGRRCLACFKHRLSATALCAREHNIEAFTTTLAGSRWKRQDQIDEAAAYAVEKVSEVQYFQMNRRKGGHQERRTILLKQYDFYNQQYCGCEFSMRHLAVKKCSSSEQS
ncbi:epoxyqueuosine reductase QueH [Turicimonas muris]|uniref:epoxyqueuosine reductase QueH n=1 Tax=Turicimonas muris TaxID=1796652 RepID=UPI002572DAF4|nr:epoxyqueuosine reductase QueH [Turicimonas muris]